MKFQLKSDKKESEVKSVRLPSDLIQRIEQTITQKEVSFSSFVIQACEFALKHMEVDE